MVANCCEMCETIFHPRVGREGTRFCSRKCHRKWQKSDEARDMVKKQMLKHFATPEAREQQSNRLKAYYKTSGARDKRRDITKRFLESHPDVKDDRAVTLARYMENNGHPMLGRKRPDFSAVVKEYNELHREELVARNKSDEARERSRRIWDDAEFKERVLAKAIRARSAKPNKIEKKMAELLKEELTGNWKYVGDDSLWIGGKNPDFVDENARAIVELFGDYWHRGQDPQFRINLFAEHGYSAIVIWEKDMKNIAAVKEKLRSFTGGALCVQ